MAWRQLDFFNSDIWPIHRKYEIDVNQVVSLMRTAEEEELLIVDCRSFLEYRARHIKSSVNISNSKVLRRRLVENKLPMSDIINIDLHGKQHVVLYARKYQLNMLPSDHLIVFLFSELSTFGRNVHLMTAGFDEFRDRYPHLCEEEVRRRPPIDFEPNSSWVDPGPSRILPFLFLGNKDDALDQEILEEFNITHVINVSKRCKKPDFLARDKFTRIPVNDSGEDKISPYFHKAIQILDEVREANTCVLVHCYAGISRSTTIVVAYVMRHLRLTLEDGLRFVKSKRPIAAPNFNFLGQLLEYEKELKLEGILKKDEKVKLPDLQDFEAGRRKRFCQRGKSRSSLSFNTRDVDQGMEHCGPVLPTEKEDDPPVHEFAWLTDDEP